MSVYDDNFDDGLLDPKWTLDKDPAGGGGLMLQEVGGVIWINKIFHHNKYIHIEQACNHDNITAIAKLRVRNTVDLFKWNISLALYWDVDNWAQVLLRYHTDDEAKRYVYATWNDASTFDKLAGSQAVVIDTWYWVKLALSPTEVNFYSSINGTSWNLIKTLTRPAGMSGAPSLFILGCGHGDNPEYPNADFDNSEYGVQTIILEADDFIVEGVPSEPLPKVALNLGLPAPALTTFEVTEGEPVVVI